MSSRSKNSKRSNFQRDQASVIKSLRSQLRGAWELASYYKNLAEKRRPWWKKLFRIEDK